MYCYRREKFDVGHSWDLKRLMLLVSVMVGFLQDGVELSNRVVIEQGRYETGSLANRVISRESLTLYPLHLHYNDTV